MSFTYQRALHQPEQSSALVGLYWRAGPAGASVMLGDLSSGYMITPLSDAIQPRLEAAAAQRGVAWLLAPELLTLGPITKTPTAISQGRG